MRTYKKNKRKRQRRYKGGRPERHTNKSKRQFSKREKRMAAESAAAHAKAKRRRAAAKRQHEEDIRAGKKRADGRDPRRWVRWARDPAVNAIRAAQNTAAGRVAGTLGRGALSTARSAWTMATQTRPRGGTRKKRKKGGSGLRKVKRATSKKTKRVRFPLEWDKLRQTMQFSPDVDGTRKRWRKGYQKKIKGEIAGDPRDRRRRKVFDSWHSAREPPSKPFQLGLTDEQVPCRFDTARILDNCRRALQDLHAHNDNKLLIKERFTSTGRRESECQRLIAQCDGELNVIKYLSNHN